MGEKDKAERMLENYADVFADIVNVLMFGGKRLCQAMAAEWQDVGVAGAGESDRYR